LESNIFPARGELRLKVLLGADFVFIIGVGGILTTFSLFLPLVVLLVGHYLWTQQQ
jgi:hypothetical protein